MNLQKYLKTCVLVLCLQASPAVLAQEGYPKDVQALIERADGCAVVVEEIRQESGQMNPQDLERRLSLYCRDLDKQIVALKARYPDRADVAQKLAEYDDVFQMVHWLQVSGLM
ncbi:hypothetical protein AB8Q18_10300 [Neisseriaceae bacterium CLB008]